MQFENITCPHCGLLCDDLSVQVDDLSLRLLKPIHETCANAYVDASLKSDALPSPLIEGKSVSVDQAVQMAAEILRGSSLPLVSGLIGDVQMCRNAIELTEKIAGVIDHANGSIMYCSNAVMQRIGEVKTTLAEVRNRADCVVIFGSGVLKKFPRFVDRVLQPPKTLNGVESVTKKIFVLDIANDGVTRVTSEENNITRMLLNFPLLESLVYRFQEIITRPKESITNIDSDTQKLLDILRTVSESKYSTVVWSASEFKQESVEQTVQAITESIKLLMKDIRCVGLPLSGSKGEITANQVATWQTGVPLPVSFLNGTPIHNPVLYSGSNMLRNQEVDCLVWISTYNSADVPPDTNIPRIVLGHPKMKCENAKIYIPTGVPGIDIKGLAVRTDSVATLPLQTIRTCNLRAVSEVLQNITRLI